VTASFDGLSGRQDDFKLDKAAEALDSIQVNPGSSNQEQLASFRHDTANPEHPAERVSKSLSVLAGHVSRSIASGPAHSRVRTKSVHLNRPQTRGS
jgi:hypothetical protein